MQFSSVHVLRTRLDVDWEPIELHRHRHRIWDPPENHRRPHETTRDYRRAKYSVF